MTAYKTEHGRVVLKASIAKSQVRPVYVKEGDGKLVAYLRVKDENIAVPNLMIKAWEMQGKESGQLFTFSAAEKALLSFLEENPLSSVEDYIYSAHISTATAENIVARLLAAGVVEMVHTPAGFRLRMVESE